MKIIERLLEKRIRSLVNLDETQFGFMPGKGTMEGCKKKKKYRAKEKDIYVFC